MYKIENLSLHDLLSIYFQHKELRKDTERSYLNVVKRFEKYYNRTIYLNEVSVEKVLEFRHHILHENLSSNQTWNTYHRHFSALYNFAIEHSLINFANPFKKMKVKMICPHFSGELFSNY
ncbi:phage integrase SAM-like domain-containing protein [Orbus mooreae]|uniref:phage integrase SAM-like domain-containing protein n=1 Tax=Orbus mooreae TaxID=3074107 RepID=UPI00370D8921